jgi:hypothetical protein
MTGYESMTKQALETIENAKRSRVPVIALWIRGDAPDFVVENISRALAMTASELRASALLQIDRDGTRVAAGKNMLIELIHPPGVRHELDGEIVGARLSFHMLNSVPAGSA